MLLVSLHALGLFWIGLAVGEAYMWIVTNLFIRWCIEYILMVDRMHHRVKWISPPSLKMPLPWLSSKSRRPLGSTTRQGSFLFANMAFNSSSFRLAGGHISRDTNSLRSAWEGQQTLLLKKPGQNSGFFYHTTILPHYKSTTTLQFPSGFSCLCMCQNIVSQFRTL